MGVCSLMCGEGAENRKTNTPRGEFRGPLCDPQGLLFPPPCAVCFLSLCAQGLLVRNAPAHSTKGLSGIARLRFFFYFFCWRSTRREFATGNPLSWRQFVAWAPHQCDGMSRCRNSPKVAGNFPTLHLSLLVWVSVLVWTPVMYG